MSPFKRDASRTRSTSERASRRLAKALGQSLGRSLAVVTAMVAGLVFASSAAHAGPISLSIRVQKEFFKAQAVTTTRVVTCFKTDPNTGVQTMGLCTETVTETRPPAPPRAPAAVPPPPKNSTGTSRR